MKESYQTRLWVNSQDIELHPFVEQFVGGTVAGAVRTLKGAEGARNIELKVRKKAVDLSVDGRKLELTEFPSDILRNVATAVASSLKGVDTIESLQIDIKVDRKAT